MTASPDPAAGLTVTSENAETFGAFSEHRKTATTRISDFTMPPGTTYQTPEGLRAEDEETRIAFDVQGGVYPIRESVFKASYRAALLATPAPLDVAWAVAEAALPDGWACMVSGEGEPPKPKYLARAGRIKFHWPPEVIWAEGDSPAAALRALAARLLEESVSYDQSDHAAREGVPEADLDDHVIPFDPKG